LNGASGGLQIRLRKMNHAQLSDDGKTVKAGGGILQWELVEKLYKSKKGAVTGLCECVSAAGPLLGGGHSMLQGKHGFAADNLVSARVVTAEGIAVTASEEKNSDLFWAIRGAGHNFGVVTSLEMKTYSVAKTWTMVAFAFTQDKLEKFFNTWNTMEAKHEDPGLLVLNGLFARNTDVDTENVSCHSPTL
jgi:FAD/FMN-containing dehydrogenase